MNPLAMSSEGCDKAGARAARAPAEALYSWDMSLFFLIAGYVAASMMFNEPRLYSSVSGLIPTIWWTAVFGKLCTLAVMAALIGYRLKSLSLGWKPAGWGRLEPARELRWAAACALVVWVVAELFLRDDSNRAGAAAAASVASSSGKLIFFLSSCLLTGMLEELVYRGGLRAFLSRGDESRKANAVFVCVSAAMFSAFHWLSSPADYVVYAVMGAVFAGTLVRSGSLRAVMLAHVLVNTAHLYGLGNYVRYLLGRA